MDELMDLLNYYGRERYYQTMRNIAKEALLKDPNSASLKYYSALPLLQLNKITDFVKESSVLKSDREVGLAIHLGLNYCSRRDTSLFSENEIKDIDSQISILRKRAEEKALMHAVNFFISINRYNKAKEYSDRLLKSYPNSSRGLALRGWVEFISENPNSYLLASDYFVKSQAYSNKNIDSIFGQILCMKLKGETSEALELVNRLVLQLHDSLPPLIEKAKIYISACKWEEAKEVIEVLLGINDKCLPALYLNAMCLICGEGKFSEAASVLRKLFMEAEISESSNASFFSDTASLFSKICDGNVAVLDETLKYSEKAVQIHQGNAVYLTELGYQYLLKGRTKEAIKVFRNAMKTDEVSLAALIGITKAHMIEGGNGLEQAFKNIKLLNEVHGSETSSEVMLMTAIMNRSNGLLGETKKLLKKTILKHLNAVNGMCVGSKYLTCLDPDFLLNAVCECLIITPVISVTTSFVDDICLVSSEVLQPAIDVLQHLIVVFPGLKKAHLLLARALFMAGNVSNAKSILHELIEKIDSNSSSAYLFLAQYFSETKEMEEASLYIESGLSYDFNLGHCSLYYLVKSRILKEQGDLAGSITMLKNGLKELPSLQEKNCSQKMLSLSDDVSIYLELAEAYFSSGNVQEAKKTTSDALEKYQGTSEIGRIILTSADLAFKGGDAKEGLSFLNSISRDSPYYVRGRQQLAEYYFNEMKDVEKYASCYKDIVDWCGGTCQSNLLYGNALMNIHELDRAIEAFELVLSKESGNARAIFKMGDALIKAHQYGKAITYLKEESDNVERPLMRITLARLLIRMKQNERAERILVKELEENKGNKETILHHHLQVLLLLSKVYVNSEKIESSITTLQKALEIQLRLVKKTGLRDENVGTEEKNIVNTCTKIAFLYEKLGNHGDALSFLKRGLSYAPNDIPALEALCSVCVQLGDQEQCRNTCNIILKLEPTNKFAVIMLADLSLRHLDFDSAAFHLEQILEHHHQYWDAFSKLIEVKRRAGRLDEVPELLKGDSNSDCSTPFGLAYCRGLHSWYMGKYSEALHHFHYSKRSIEWTWQSLCNMVEIYLYPAGESLPGGVLKDNSKGASITATDDMAMAIESAKRLLLEQQKLCQSKEQHLQWRLLDLTALMASREKQNIELALRELTAMATAPDARVDHVGVALGLATAHLLLRQGSRARNHLKRVLRNQWNPEDANNLERVWLLLADHYYSSGKNESAAELLQRALQHNKSCMKAHELLGQVMEKAQSFNDAVASYEIAWKMGMKVNLNVGYKLAHAQMKAKRFAEAIDICHEVLSNSSGDSRIKKEILEKCRFALRS